MKPDVKKLVDNFQATFRSVKSDLKAKGFVLPVAHNGGIKFLHVFVKKNSGGFYDITNLHNPKIVYYSNICVHKIAMAIAIKLGKKQEIRNIDQILGVDNRYCHHLQNIRIYKHTSNKALEAGDNVRSEIVLSRIDYHYDALKPIKQEVNTILDDAEKLLFDNK